jgi:hypothetical protein
LTATTKKIPAGLAKVRKAMPPPGKIFKSKHTDSRKRAREKLQRELEESLAHRSRQIFAAIFAWGQPNPAAPLFFALPAFG